MKPTAVADELLCLSKLVADFKRCAQYGGARLLAILLTGGEAHDCPVADRQFRRVKPTKYTIGDKPYHSTELREGLDQCGTKPVVPDKPVGKSRPASISASIGEIAPRAASGMSFA